MDKTVYSQECRSEVDCGYTDMLEFDGGAAEPSRLRLTDRLKAAATITDINRTKLRNKCPRHIENGSDTQMTQSIDFSRNSASCENDIRLTCSLPANVRRPVRNSRGQLTCDNETNKARKNETFETFEVTPLRSQHNEAQSSAVAREFGTEKNVAQNNCKKKAEHSRTRQLDSHEQTASCETLKKENNSDTRLPPPSVDEETVSQFEPLMSVIDKLADGQTVRPQITMQYEMLRFCTLRSYPKENKPFIIRLAEAGFYYANSGDELICYCCAQRKSSWTETDIPLEVHRQMNPNCRFLLHNAEVNVPIKPRQLIVDGATNSGSNSSTLTANTVGCSPSAVCSENQNSTQINNPTSDETPKLANNQIPDVCTGDNSQVSGVQETREREQTNSDQLTSSTTTQRQQLSRSSESRETLVHTQEHTQEASSRTLEQASSSDGQLNSTREITQRPSVPKYPKYASETVRLASFRECKEIAQTPKSLAESGLFYVGFGDCVRCFQCGVGLRHWSVEDDPWIEHSRWSKDCSFVKQMRGQEFVNLVQMAVRYAQSHGEDGSQISSGDHTAAARDDETENLLHTDAAQSVLEMGYHPNVIRIALRQFLARNGRHELTAVKLMEVILESEEADTTEQAVSDLQSYTESKPSANIDSTKPATTSGPGQIISKTKRGEVNPSYHKEKSLELEKKKIKAENEKMKQQSICTKCKINDVCIVFLPCGHLVTCEACAPSVRYCPIQGCGKYIKGTVRTYMA